MAATFLLAAAASLFFSLSPSHAHLPHSPHLTLTSRPTSPTADLQTYIEECLSNAECSATTYCGYLRSATYSSDCNFGVVPCASTPRRCVPRLSAGTPCAVGGGDCASGLYCAFLPRRATSDPVCAPQVPAGAECSLSATYPCADGLVCDRVTQRCAPFTTGLAGERCRYDRHCNHQRGFYCKNNPRPRGPQDYDGVCTPKKTPGDVCGVAADNFECAGFCQHLGFDPVAGGVCFARRKIGQVCSESSQCRMFPVWRDERTQDAVCNVHQGVGFRQGLCAMERDLLRGPGVECDPGRDMCDARRKLRCEKFGGRFVCVQRSGLGGPCTRGSPFSFCSVKKVGAPLECRRAMTLTRKAPHGADVCSRVRETVRQGEVCNKAEHAVCEEGTTCVAGPRISNPGGKYPPPPLAYCMKEVPPGGDCSDRCDTFCAEGSFCVDGICRKAASKPVEDVVFSGVSVDCTVRPCAPGLECRPWFGRKSCQLPALVAGPWETCSSNSTNTFTCVDGTECTRGLEWVGIKRCRPVGGVGAFCEKDSACKGALKCGPSDPNDFLSTRTCYDPAKATPLGLKCNPKQSTCVIGKNQYEKAKCLPKGSSSFACQVESTLFMPCSDTENIGCASGLVCSGKSVCVPVGEAV